MDATPTSEPGAFLACPQHPGAPAQFACARCRTAVCQDCCYSLPEGGFCCKTCYEEAAELPAAAPAAAPAVTLPPGAGCVQHPQVEPIAFCQRCGIGSCATCDFVFPGGVHLCPGCATSAPRKLSPRRKKYLTAAFVLAGWASLCFLALLSGALAGLAEDEASQTVLGIVLILFMLFPTVIGTALGMSALRKGGPNPVSVWIALLWNALMLAVFILMTIVGNLSE